VHNLIDNAIKYTPDGGKLTVECRPEKHTARVSISNTGAGIAKEDLPHVFDRFYKTEKAHTPSGSSGTGLGLSIAKLIIDQHGQDISASSGDGETRFSFTLKKAAKPAVKKAKEANS
jgi:signal transduction histidine kinase